MRCTTTHNKLMESQRYSSGMGSKPYGNKNTRRSQKIYQMSI